MWINPKTMEVSGEPVDGYEWVMSTQYPLTARLEKAVPGAPSLIDGQWQQTWVLEPLADSEIAQVEEAERVNAGNPLTAALERNNAAYEAALAALTTGYPKGEIATFERQREESLAWEADPAAVTLWIDAASAERGIPRAEYLARTLPKAKGYLIASAILTGRRQGYDDAIKAGAVPPAVFDYSLPSAGQ